MNYFKFLESNLIKFSDNIIVKIVRLCDDIDSFIKEELPNQLNLTGDVFQIVVKLENYIKALFNSKLGIIVEFVKDEDPNYIRRIIPSNKPKMLLNRKFSMDLIKIVKNNLSIKTIKDKLTREIKAIIESLSSGKEPFKESFNISYLIFEVEGTAEAGTLASFKGVLPVEPVSLIDTDGEEKDLIAKETKKNCFLLKPTKEQLQYSIIKNIVNLGLNTNLYEKYINLIRFGNIKILRLCLSEVQNSLYKKLGSKITISKIYYR